MKNIFFLLSILIFSVSCQKNQKEVVVYTSVDQVFSEPILKDFEKETGIRIKALYDTEETKSTGVLNRLIAEKNNPQCDVFWSGDPIRSIVLKTKGITQAYTSNMAEDIDVTYKDSENHWTGFSARARVLLYNTNLAKEFPIPQSIFDLTKDVYKSKVSIANPLFGTTTFHIAALFDVLGDEKAKAFMQGLKENDVVLATSNGDVKKRVMKAEVFCGLTDTDDAFEALEEGAPVAFVFLDQQGIGSLIMPNTLSLIHGGPHPENGKKLIDYLLRKETEVKLAKSCAQMPLHKGVISTTKLPSLEKIIPMKINYDNTSKKLTEIQNYLKEWSEN